MDKPQWQKAQIKNSENIHISIRGKQVWLKIGPPVLNNGEDWGGGERIDQPSYYVNFEPPFGMTNVAISTNSIMDLLPEFAEDVDIIPYEVWSNRNV